MPKEIYIAIGVGPDGKDFPESAWETHWQANQRRILIEGAADVLAIPYLTEDEMAGHNGDHVNPHSIGNRGFSYEAFKAGYKAYGTKQKNPYPKKLALELWENWEKGREAARNE